MAKRGKVQNLRSMLKESSSLNYVKDILGHLNHVTKLSDRYFPTCEKHQRNGNSERPNNLGLL